MDTSALWVMQLLGCLVACLEGRQQDSRGRSSAPAAQHLMAELAASLTASGVTLALCALHRAPAGRTDSGGGPPWPTRLNYAARCTAQAIIHSACEPASGSLRAGYLCNRVAAL
jgi:hypothetical protein